MSIYKVEVQISLLFTSPVSEYVPMKQLLIAVGCGIFIVSKGTTYLFLSSFRSHCFNNAEEEMCSLYTGDVVCLNSSC